MPQTTFPEQRVTIRCFLKSGTVLDVTVADGLGVQCMVYNLQVVQSPVVHVCNLKSVSVCTLHMSICIYYTYKYIHYIQYQVNFSVSKTSA